MCVLNHVGKCWVKMEGGLQVYILVSELFPKITFSDLSFTINNSSDNQNSKNNHNFLEQSLKNSYSWRKSIGENATGC